MAVEKVTPRVRAELLEDLGTLYITRGRPVEAEPLLRESVAILDQAAEQDSPLPRDGPAIISLHAEAAFPACP
jgi:hypothetical protein